MIGLRSQAERSVDAASPAGVTYLARLETASGIGAASFWSVPAGAEGPHPYLALKYRVRDETFHRVWVLRPGEDGEVQYSFVGDTSVSLPGAVPPELARMAASSLLLSHAIRVREPRRRD